MYNGIASGMPENGRGVFSSFLYQNTQLAANYAAAGFRLDNLVGGIWNNYYFALADYRKTLELIEEQENPASYTNVRAMLTTLIAYKTLRNTTLFGDIPFAEAGMAFKGGQHYRPVYDGQETIFTTALADLKWAADNFSTSSGQVELGAYETLLQGDISKWIKFTNSLRLRYALVMREKNAAAADAIIAEVLTKPLLAPDEYLGVEPIKLSMEINRGPAFRGNSYVRMGSTIWEAMSSSNAVNGSGIFDLRTRIFFEPNSDGEWKPYPQNPPTGTVAETDNGASGGINDPYREARLTTWTPAGEYHYSPLNLYYVNDRTFPDLFITGSEVSFLKAEIYNRGIAGVAASAATAKQYYDEGITASVKYWYKLANGSAVWTVNKPAAEPTPGELSTMLSNPAVAYSATPADALKQIYQQHWISLFHQPFDAWTLKRRTGNATPNVPLAPTSEALNLNRLVYPTGEITANYDNWLNVTGGTDDRTKKSWFMP
ncbi:MAG: SusD/RagB family nutrient-binding outer membrane lipoprotein [Chitinophagaceae bacterium]|nr:SusD/RagB family nutrient-binding outer membrane lipoprotein [Chitinophagaceae bacterium]MCW5928008.1 SusD/RagB family nutrient-binding outer membrane lipoprotein [Chitinophagaceae bacterium]